MARLLKHSAWLAAVGAMSFAWWPVTSVAQERATIVLAVPSRIGQAENTQVASDIQSRLGTRASVSVLGVGQARSVLEDLRQGKIDVAVLPLSEVARTVPGFRIYEMSFAFPSGQAMQDFSKGTGETLLAEELRTQGFGQMGRTWYTGAYQLAAKKPIRSPAEIQGTKIISGPNPTFDAQFRNAGASPVQLAFADRYSALQTGVADSIEIRWDDLPNLKGALPYVTESNHRYSGLVALYSQKAFEGRLNDVKAQVEVAIGEVGNEVSRATTAREAQVKRDYLQPGIFTHLTINEPIRKDWQISVKLAAQADTQSINPAIVKAAVAGVPPPVAPAPATRATWNAWVEEGSAKVSPMVVGRAYKVVLDLSRAPYPGTFSGTASNSVEEKVTTGGASVTLLVKPLLLGKSLKTVDDKPIEARRLVVQRERVKRGDSDTSVLSEFVSSGKSLRDLARTLSVAEPLEWDVVAKDSGCARVAFSIWNATGNKPLDYLVVTLPVVIAGQSLPACAQGVVGGALAAGLGGFLNDDLQSKGSFDAALHFFDIEDNGPSTVGVYMRRSDMEAAEKANKPLPLLSWQLDVNLGVLFENPAALPSAITNAHKHVNTPDPYADSVGAISRALFSGRREVDRSAAAEVRASIVKLSQDVDAPIVLTRYFNPAGELRYVPLALLAAQSPDRVLTKRVRVVQDLSTAESRKPQACFAGWTFAIPKRLDGASGDMENLLRETGWRVSGPDIRWLEENKTLLEYLSTGASDQPKKGSALVLLAHHKDGKFTYSSTASPDQILDTDISRNFGDGSVAVLAACTTTGAATSTQAIVNKLARKNVSTFIVSPFQVDTTFGTRFATSFVAEAVEARRTHSTPSIAELFNGAIKRTIDQFGGKPGYRDMALELQLLGDQELKLCDQ